MKSVSWYGADGSTLEWGSRGHKFKSCYPDSDPLWDNLNEWINKGIPYSLVALDALIRLIHHPGENLLNRINPRPVLLNPSTID